MSTYNEKILIIDNDVQIRKALEPRFSRLGYDILFISDSTNAFNIFSKEQPDLIILEILLANLDGYEICCKIRKISRVPIIFLTTLGDTSSRILGFRVGADDYVTKPFSPRELEARIRAVIDRANKNFQPIKKRKKFYINDLIIDTNHGFILKDNNKINLTKIECSLLELLITNPGKELSRVNLLTKIWGYTPERIIDARLVDVHISRLRSKIESKAHTPKLILTVRGIGYMFQQY